VLARLPLDAPSFASTRDVLAMFDGWAEGGIPSVEAMNEVLGPRLDRALGEKSVRFEVQRAEVGRRRHRERAKRAVRDAYEARIDRDGRVPTREGSLHDFLNAAVWGAFPQSKRALARAQHAALCRQAGGDDSPLPSARDRDRDVLAMIDEGGVLRIRGSGLLLVLGHALLEQIVVRGDPLRAYGLELELDPGAEPALAAADVALARALADGAPVAAADRGIWLDARGASETRVGSDRYGACTGPLSDLTGREEERKRDEHGAHTAEADAGDGRAVEDEGRGRDPRRPACVHP